MARKSTSKDTTVSHSLIKLYTILPKFSNLHLTKTSLESNSSWIHYPNSRKIKEWP
ncbi:hypothetical protein H1P_300044 [Hyella patelloides LEGE 07179]|uniref:Uncharacterized protein n=1 Tax=Hyella patelloides LEGE 07179 TaxID=945734 RepID=A0A563VU71_9CYAN|nr:hypothetical protein H1P_300044 [Hyella patelloides LEGE 07179]